MCRVLYYTSVLLPSRINNYEWMYYRSGTGRGCCIGVGQRLLVTRQTAALFWIKWRHGRHWNYDVKSKIRLGRNWCVNRAEFHPDPRRSFWHWFEEVAPTQRTTTTTTTTRWVAIIWDRFLIQQRWLYVTQKFGADVVSNTVPTSIPSIDQLTFDTCIVPPPDE